MKSCSIVQKEGRVRQCVARLKALNCPCVKLKHEVQWRPWNTEDPWIMQHISSRAVGIKMRQPKRQVSELPVAELVGRVIQNLWSLASFIVSSMY